MITIEQIGQEIIKCQIEENSKPFVAAAIKIDATGEASHSGIFVSRDGIGHLLHYNSVEVKLDTPGEWYFYKVFNFITPEVVSSFLSYCKHIANNANPEYGYVYGGSLYDQYGVHFSNSGLPEVFTCVGFCLNVIKGFIEADEFIEYRDWSNTSVENTDHYLDIFIRDFSRHFPEKQIGQLVANIRRIRPSEYLSSSFFSAPFPIRKSQIDIIITNVETSIKAKRQLVA